MAFRQPDRHLCSTAEAGQYSVSVSRLSLLLLAVVLCAGTCFKTFPSPLPSDVLGFVRFTKFVRDCQLTDGTDVTSAQTDIIFASVKGSGHVRRCCHRRFCAGEPTICLSGTFPLPPLSHFPSLLSTTGTDHFRGLPGDHEPHGKQAQDFPARPCAQGDRQLSRKRRAVAQ